MQYALLAYAPPGDTDRAARPIRANLAGLRPPWPASWATSSWPRTRPPTNTS